MGNIEDFKTFVKEKPTLIQYVKDGDMSWQKFYEIWSLYGTNSDVWDKYKGKAEEKNSSTSAMFKNLSTMFKNVDMDSIRNGLGGIQKAIGLFQEVVGKGGAAAVTGAAATEATRDTYNPRPLFRKFED